MLHLSFFLFLTFQSLPRQQIILTQKAYYLKSTLNIHVFPIYINLYYIYIKKYTNLNILRTEVLGLVSPLTSWMTSMASG